MIITDARGRRWRVHDYQVIAGKTSRLPLGRGQNRGFEPLDGGARRNYLLLQADRDRGLDESVLLEQLAQSLVYFADDAAKCATWGRQPERVDPPAAAS